MGAEISPDPNKFFDPNLIPLDQLYRQLNIPPVQNPLDLEYEFSPLYEKQIPFMTACGELLNLAGKYNNPVICFLCMGAEPFGNGVMELQTLSDNPDWHKIKITFAHITRKIIGNASLDYAGYRTLLSLEDLLNNPNYSDRKGNNTPEEIIEYLTQLDVLNGEHDAIFFADTGYFGSNIELINQSMLLTGSSETNKVTGFLLEKREGVPGHHSLKVRELGEIISDKDMNRVYSGNLPYIYWSEKMQLFCTLEKLLSNNVLANRIIQSSPGHLDQLWSVECKMHLSRYLDEEVSHSSPSPTRLVKTNQGLWVPNTAMHKETQKIEKYLNLRKAINVCATRYGLHL